jgi:GntR family transcriptional regulator/MocR family aminotransferase
MATLANMKRIPTSFLPPITLERENTAPIYQQLYAWFRDAITTGQLRPGQRIPSTRSLATELNVSRIPVLTAFEQLHAEGYLETFTGAGTCVARDIPDESISTFRTLRTAAPAKRTPRRLSRQAQLLVNQAPQTWLNSLGAFRVSLPGLDHFPISTWSKIVARHSRKLSFAGMGYGGPLGYTPLREAIAEYLGAARGVRCKPSQILITTGSQQGLQLSAQVLLDPGDRVWMEEPGYPGARQAFMTARAELVPIPVDSEGLNPARSKSNARVVYLTPSHQYPLGVTMSASRRLQILNWAAATNAWIIEDDYDSEYRYSTRPIAALQGLDTNARVIYIGTFSKVMFPALRLGYIVIPEDLVPAFSSTRDAADIFSSTLYQLVMTDFIREGHFARHIRRMRMLYMDRREALVKAIRTHLADKLEIIGSEAGMHLVAMLPSGYDDVEISRLAAQKRIAAMPLSSCYLRKPRRGGLILGYGATNIHQIQEGIRTLKSILAGRPK